MSCSASDSDSIASEARPTRVRLAQAITVLPGLLLILLAGRLIHIQTQMRPMLSAYADEQQHATLELPARRGVITDRQGRILAASQEVPSVYADPLLIEDISSAAGELSRVLSLDRGWVLDKLTHPTSPRFVWIKRRTDDIEADAVSRLKIRGVGVKRESKRVYPLGSSLCHVLGFVGRDQHGLEGLEVQYDDLLSGTDGRQTMLVDARRRPVWSPRDSGRLPRDGCNLTLTIDAAIQVNTERLLAEAVAEFEAESAVGIVMSPKTCEVLAMACWPNFNPNDPMSAPADARRNRSITDPTEPGSAFKPIPGAALLNEGMTYPGEVIFCHNGMARLGSRRVRDAHGFGNLTMSEVISHSSNVGMVILSERMSRGVLHDYLVRFGFGQRTGIELPGEGSGPLLPVRQWSSYSAGSIMFGQEVSVTPIQLITAFCAITNQGRLLRPHIVRSIEEPGGKCVERHVPEERGQIIRAEVARIMTEQILVQTINEGSGDNAALDDYQVLGKTGTAQLPWKEKKGYEPGSYLSSFLAAAPAHDPQVCVLVQVRKPNPQIGYYGAKVAAPTAGKILGSALPYLRVPPDRDLPGLRPGRLIHDREIGSRVVSPPN